MAQPTSSDGVPSSSPTARAINYSLKRWQALCRYLDDSNLPIDNNWIENQMRPWGVRTGCLLARYAVVSERRTS